jgi:hypothetical protein
MAMLNNQMVKIKNWRAITTAMQSATTDAGYMKLLCGGFTALKFSGLRCLRNLRELELQNSIV